MPDRQKSLAENMRTLAALAREWAAFVRAMADAQAKHPAVPAMRAVAGMLNYVAASVASIG